MNNFYIFLDIDGTMNDTEFRVKLRKEGIIHTSKVFKPESVDALNFLIDYLSKNYNVNLVISSVWRIDMNKTLFYLNKNKINLNKVKKVDKTKFLYDENNKNLRDDEIKEYLKSIKEYKNFVVLDDEVKSFNLSQINLIETNIKNDALSLNKVKIWLNKFFNLNLEKTE